ncbi:MAG: leucine-rich repeat protein [Clostridiales bacterium]|nr:leucine-rich repeat protein [Clostridiales bacterium]
MKRKYSKVTALILTLAMSMSLPSPVLATETESKSSTAAAETGTTEEAAVTIEAMSTATDSSVLDSGSCGDNVSWELSSDYILTISGTGNMNSNAYCENYCEKITEVVIQDGVTSVGDGAFFNCTNLKNITIPDSVTSIGECAFFGCTGLTKVVIPDGVTAIGGSAFNGCTGLTEMEIPDKVTEIEDATFYQCTGLTKVTIPEGVTYIGANAFCGCIGLTEVTIPVTVTSTGRGAFYGCTALADIEIPVSLISIEEETFGDTAWIESQGDFVVVNGILLDYQGTDAVITVPDTVTTIGDCAFQDCTGITSVSMADSVTTINHGAFLACTGLTSVVIPDSVTSVGNSLFYGCTSLTSVTLSDNITEIGSYTFYNCKSLTTISIPFSVVTIKSNAFSKCSALENVYYAGSESDWDSISIGSGNSYLTEATIICQGEKASQTVTATVASSSIYAGKTTTITAKTSGDGAITYKSSDTSIATVDENGKVTGKKPGTVTISITAAETDNYKASDATTVSIQVKLASPTISSVVQSGSNVTVKWGKVTGASGYYVYRSTSSGSGYSKVATITSGSTLSWKDTASKSNGKTYYYKVYAYNGSTKSAASSYKSIKYMKGTISSLTNKSSGITVKWSKVSGASGYYIYRKTSGASSYTKVKTITSASTVSYTDTAVKSKNGTTYTYYVQPYNSTSKGAYAAKKTVRLTGTSLSSVKNSAAKKMTVKWSKKSGVSGYQIQYSTSSSFSSGNKTVTVSGASSASKVVSSLTKGKKYYVRVRTYKTISGTKYYSAWSSAKSVKISK